MNENTSTSSPSFVDASIETEVYSGGQIHHKSDDDDCFSDSSSVKNTLVNGDESISSEGRCYSSGGSTRRSSLISDF